MGSTTQAAGVAEFEAQRQRMFGIAYRMLGSAAEAEDVVQDAYLRWAGAERDSIGMPGAWLAKVVTNLSLNRLSSARVRREEYVGEWLPEPVLTGGGALEVFGPLESAEQRDSVSLALLVVLERLTPVERAVFILREAFAYGHGEIAAVLDVSEASCRQLYRRAKQAVAAGRARAVPEPVQWQGLVERFLAAAREGDLGRLESLLAEDAVSRADGGRKINVARWPILGREKVARYLAGGISKWAEGVDLVPAEVNGGPAVLASVGGQVVAVVAIEVREGRIGELRIVANPEKLGFAERQLSHSAGLSGS